MKMRLLPSLLFTAFAVASLSVQAQPVTNWHTFRATTATTLSGQGTSNPVLGSTNLTGSGAFFVGYFDPISLTNAGDRLILTFQVSFTDLAGFTNANDNFRFALFDLNGQTPVTVENSATAGVDARTDDWRGYWYGVKHGTTGGSIRERMALISGDNPFSATGGNTGTAPSLGLVGGTGVSFLNVTNQTFSAQMILEKTTTGVSLGGYFAGPTGTNQFLAPDNTSPWPASYGAFGILNGGPLSCDQMNFQNVLLTYSSTYLPVEIVNQPSSIQVFAGQSATFQVTWTNGPLIPPMQWRENEIDIPNATNASYTVTNATLAQNGNVYSVVIQNILGDHAVSSNATLTVVVDNTVPTVLSASSLASNLINVIFSETVDAVSAQDGSSYQLPGVSVTPTLVGTSNVLLTLDSPIGSNYVITVQNVKDLSGNTVGTTNVAGVAHGFENTESVGLTNNFGLAFAFNDKIKVYADGADIFGTIDQFQYVYKKVSGDFDVAVRIESLLNTSASAKAGLMARIGNAFPPPATVNDMRNVMIEATPSRFIFQYRTNTTGADSVALASPRPLTDFPNCWVRLVRTGAVLTSYSSTNYATWDLIGSVDTSIDAQGAYPDEILLGLAVTSHAVNQVTEAVFSGFGTPIARPTLSVAKTGDSLELSWPISAIGFTLQAAPALTTPATTWTNVPGSSATNRVTVPTSDGASFFRLSN